MYLKIKKIKCKNKLKTTLSDEKILGDTGFIYEGKLTVARALLFSKNPEKFFPSCRIRFIRYDGLEGRVGTEMNIIKDISIYESLHKMLEEARVVIDSQLRGFKSLNPKTGKFEIVTEYPEFAWVKRIYKDMNDYFLDEPKFSEPSMNSLKLTLKNNIVMRKIRLNNCTFK